MPFADMLLQHGHVKSQQCFPIARWAKRTVSMGKANAQKKPAGKVHAKKPVKKDKFELPTTANEPHLSWPTSQREWLLPPKSSWQREESLRKLAHSLWHGVRPSSLPSAAHESAQ